MTATTARMPTFGPRMLAMPLLRLVVLGAALFVMLVMSNDVMLALSGRPLAAAAGVAGMTAAGLAVYVGFARLVERRRVEELSLPGMGRELGLGLAIGAGLYAACVLVLLVLGIYRIEGLNPWSFLLPALAMALSSGIFEELLFRGVLFRSVEQVFGSWVALVVSSLVFGFVHLLNPAGTVMGALFISIEAGLLLAAAYMLTRRLWLSMGFHMAWNYTQSAIFSGIVSGGDTDPGLIRATIAGPAALTGGSFGLESSLVAFVVCTATGLVLLTLAIRRGRVRPPAWRRTA
ncbi:CPBP family intramembrane metalloprotease [Falsiroseomonas bella]|uniref:CPBP family intramembrane metalloprotease n=1 Tax=Falsiroseomonas bella TaxID=2184016 RepID=A0A317FDP8_9PROT|nr:type II CAAX endopeptidase family protein [Falsiroseomonas bella]PWS37201.1 CPBP family intramembrane metalloprotease [Falsiroseomonas bella]